MESGAFGLWLVERLACRVIRGGSGTGECMPLMGSVARAFWNSAKHSPVQNCCGHPKGQPQAPDQNPVVKWSEALSSPKILRPPEGSTTGIRPKFIRKSGFFNCQHIERLRFQNAKAWPASLDFKQKVLHSFIECWWWCEAPSSPKVLRPPEGSKTGTLTKFIQKSDCFFFLSTY